MNSKIKWAIRITAMAIVTVLSTGLLLTQTGALSGLSAARSSIKLSTGEVITYQQAQAPPKEAAVVTEPKPALPKVGDMTELIRLYNQMGVLRKADPWYAVDEALAPKESRLIAPAPDAAYDADFDMAEEAPAVSATAGGEGAGGGYSATNTQVEGVDEGDIVKTDGQYLYIAQNTQISIVRAQGPEMGVVSTIPLSGNSNIREMYVTGDRLVLVTSRWEEQTYDPEADVADSYIWKPSKNFTGYDVYDISDRSDPNRVRLFEAEGDPLATRLVGDSLYFATSKYVWSIVFDEL